MVKVKVGMVGLGDIAQKAYLPVLGVRDDVILHISTRNSDTLHRIGDAYRVPLENRFHDFRQLIGVGLDAVFIHTATEAHYDIAKQCLDAGLHVFVDKPVDYSLQRTEELLTLARQRKSLLMVGFNRRFAPMYRRLYGEGTPGIVIMQKNRVNLPGDPRTFILDDFIHVVDTVRYFNQGPWKDLYVQWKLTEEGMLAHVLFHLAGHESTAVGIMNRDSGINEETVEWMQSGCKYTVTNLRELVEYTRNEEKRIHTGDWASIGEVRGFKAMVDDFLGAVRSMQSGDSSVWTEFTARMTEDLTTHQLCEEIINRIEADNREL